MVGQQAAHRGAVGQRERLAVAVAAAVVHAVAGDGEGADQVAVAGCLHMFSVGTSFRLPVSIGRVWRLLVDIERYGDWHPTLRFTGRSGYG